MDWTDSLPHPAIRALPSLTDNYIWMLRAAATPAALVVDPGSAEPVMAALREEQRDLTAILITHHHRDHVGALPALRQAWPQVQVYGPAQGTIPGITHPVTAGMTVRIPGFAPVFEVLEVPGHTLDHLAYYAPATATGHPPVLFCGDTLFGAGCGRLFEGTAAQLWHALQRLQALPPATLVYCAHEYTLANLAFARSVDPNNPHVQARQVATAAMRQRGQPSVPSTLALEQATNPFLRTHDAALQHYVAQQLGRPAHDEIEVLATLRRSKDTF